MHETVTATSVESSHHLVLHLRCTKSLEATTLQPVGFTQSHHRCNCGSMLHKLAAALCKMSVLSLLLPVTCICGNICWSSTTGHYPIPSNYRVVNIWWVAALNFKNKCCCLSMQIWAVLLDQTCDNSTILMLSFVFSLQQQPVFPLASSFDSLCSVTFVFNIMVR